MRHVSHETTGDLIADLINKAAGYDYPSIADELDALVARQIITDDESARLFRALDADNPGETAGLALIDRLYFHAGLHYQGAPGNRAIDIEAALAAGRSPKPDEEDLSGRAIIVASDTGYIYGYNYLIDDGDIVITRTDDLRLPLSH